jgi:hypothetical protein
MFESVSLFCPHVVRSMTPSRLLCCTAVLKAKESLCHWTTHSTHSDMHVMRYDMGMEVWGELPWWMLFGKVN